MPDSHQITPKFAFPLSDKLYTNVIFDMAPPNRIHQEAQYIFDDDIPICIYDGLVINISKLLK